MSNFEHFQALSSLGFDVKRGRDQQKTVCPQNQLCKHPNAENKKDLCVSINVTDGVYNCHKCGLSGTVKKIETRQRKPLKTYQRPKVTDTKKVSQRGSKYLKSRGLSQTTIDKLKMRERHGAIFLPYLRDGKLINFKTRPLDKKDFRQAGGAEAIMYNYDLCVDASELVITEGEFDAASIIEIGIDHATSPNQGAPNENDKNVDKKLECIDNSFEMFENKTKIILAVDNDPNGRRLEKELIRRLGAERCWRVDFGQYKDANEVLVEVGAEKLREIIDSAEPVPVSGVWTVDDVRDTMIDTFLSGKRHGVTTHIKEIDTYFTWRTGDLNIWTGYHNEGKTTALGQLLLLRAKHDGEKVGIFSPENAPPDEFFDDLIHTHVGMNTDKRYKNVMTLDQYKDAMRFLNDHFFINLPEQLFTLDTLIEKFTYLVRRHGVRHIVFDPWNQIDHDMRAGEREDLYISRVFSRLKRFALENDVTVNIVMHQNTPRGLKIGEDYPQPTSYGIKGGGTAGDKADNVIVIWRPHFRTDKTNTLTMFISDKIKKTKLVGIQGEQEMSFDRVKNRYIVNGRDPFSGDFEITSAITEGSSIEPNVSFYEVEKEFDENDDNDDAPF